MKKLNSKKILFLDIDGVINSIDNMKALYCLYELDSNNKSKDKYGCFFDERCLMWLNLIIQKTGCKIVLSSTWRDSGLSVIQDMWRDRNLPGEVIDVTPPYAANGGPDRGDEIQEWLDANDYQSYCIVDDMSDMLESQMKYFVRTDSVIGITGKEARQIIMILNSNN